MTERRSSPLVPMLLAAAVVGGAIAWLHRPARATDDPLGACPANAFLVAKVDITALRATPVADLVEQALRGLVPLPHDPQGACDALGHLESLALVVPEGDERSDLGVALKLGLTKDQLARCAEVVQRNAAERGVTPAPAPQRQGAFTSFATGEPRADTLAAAENGLVLLGSADWTANMAQAGSGRAPSAGTTPPHASMLQRLGAHAIVASIVLPKATRARIRREMEGELGDSERAAMQGVLGVEAVGAALDLRAETSLAFELRCDTAASCGAVNDLLTRKRKQWSASPIVRLLGIGPAADALTIKHESARLSIATHLDTTAVRDALERALAFRSSRAQPHAPNVPEPTPAAPADGGADAP